MFFKKHCLHYLECENKLVGHIYDRPTARLPWVTWVRSVVWLERPLKCIQLRGKFQPIILREVSRKNLKCYTTDGVWLKSIFPIFQDSPDNVTGIPQIPVSEHGVKNHFVILCFQHFARFSKEATSTNIARHFHSPASFILFSNILLITDIISSILSWFLISNVKLYSGSVLSHSPSSIRYCKNCFFMSSF